jgi:glycosyltransferase involved in cell wall biosynthesis
VISGDIGVVVIGRNEGRRLIDCLQSIAPDAISIVYVDSGSTDGSANAAEQMGASVVRLDLMQPFTAARARNEGFATLLARHSNIQFVQFIDGDCELDRGWLNRALLFMNHRNDVGIVCGRRRERYPSTSVYNRLCDIEWDTPTGQVSACGGDSLIRVEAFRAVGGFRAQLIAGEEPELCVRLREKGWKIWRLDSEMTRHDAAMRRFGQWWMRGVRSGYATVEVSRLHKHSPFGIWKRETRSAIFWSGLLPLAIGLAMLASSFAILGILIYPLQICRIASYRGIRAPYSWTYALFTLLAQFPAFQGILKFHWHRFIGSAGKLIEYKQSN